MNIILDDLPLVWDSKYGGEGYFSGAGGAILTIAGQPASREITCFNADTLEVIRKVWSFDNGHFLVPNLDPNLTILLISRDYKVEYRPKGWDRRKPATTMTYAEQQAKLKEWENGG